MDETLEKALEFANFSATLNNQKAILYNKYIDDSALYYQGCKFTVTMTLFSFVSNLVTQKINKTVLIDDNNVPTTIENTEEFLDLLKEKYAFATNAYLESYKELKSKRSIEGLVDV